jgi:hypothetical protein
MVGAYKVKKLDRLLVSDFENQVRCSFIRWKWRIDSLEEKYPYSLIFNTAFKVRLNSNGCLHSDKA